MSKKKKLGALIIILVVISATAALIAAPRVVGGPFVVGVTSETATIAWIVQSDEIRVRPSGAGTGLSTPSFRVEKSTLSGLKPNTRYDYDIASAGEAGKGSFKTPPFGPTGPFEFVVYGDNRTRADMHRNVMGQLLKHGIPDFVIQTGDMVANGDDSSQWAEFFDIERDLLRQTAFFPALGNHERNTRYFTELFQQGPSYYSFEWGNAHFVVLNSDIMTSTTDPQKKKRLWEAETRWLEEDLKSHQDATFRFVAAHHPPMTAVRRRQNENPHIAALLPMFEKYHVTAGFFGHDHNYQHFFKGGIHYITTGGGGAPLYDVDLPPEEITRKVISVENFVSVAVNGNTVQFKAIAVDGRVLDDFQVRY